MQLFNSPMNIYLIGILVPLLSFFLQIWPRFKNKYFGVDPWHHLLVTEYIRKHKKLPVSLAEHYVVPGTYSYPPVLFLFLSLLPKKITDEYNYIFSPIFDALHNYMIFLAAFLLSGNLMAALSAQIIAALTPVTVLEASILNARVLSYLFLSASFFCLLLFSVNGNFLWLAIAASVLALLFFTHKFGIQAYAFLVIIFSLVERNILYIGFFVGVYILVIIFGGKRYRLIFKEHKDAIFYWYKHRNERFYHQFKKTDKDVKKRQFVDRMFLISQKLPFFSIFAETPWMIAFFGIMIVSFFNLYPLVSTISPIMFNKLALWVISLTLIGLLVLSIKRLRCIGEGYRYIEYVIFPMSIMIGSYIPFLYSKFTNIFIPIATATLAVLLLGILFLQKKVILQDRNRTITKEKWEVIKYLNKNVGKKLRLGIFPLQEGDAFLYFTNGKVLTADSLELLEILSDMYPVVTKKMDDFVKKYGLNYIFFDTKYVTLKELGIKKYKIVLDLNGFMLLKV